MNFSKNVFILSTILMATQAVWGAENRLVKLSSAIIKLREQVSSLHKQHEEKGRAILRFSRRHANPATSTASFRSKNSFLLSNSYLGTLNFLDTLLKVVDDEKNLPYVAQRISERIKLIDEKIADEKLNLKIERRSYYDRKQKYEQFFRGQDEDVRMGRSEKNRMYQAKYRALGIESMIEAMEDQKKSLMILRSTLATMSSSDKPLHARAQQEKHVDEGRLRVESQRDPMH